MSDLPGAPKESLKSALRFPLLLLGTSFLGSAWLSLSPTPGQAVAAVFPPWWSLSETVAAMASAGGHIMRPGAWNAILVGQSADPHFVTRLRTEGAWLVLNPQALGICGSATKASSVNKGQPL